MEYVGFWGRVLAALIDVVICSFFIWLMAMPLTYACGVDPNQDFLNTLFDKTEYGTLPNSEVLIDFLIYLAILLGVSTLILGVYDTIFPATRMMGTPGKWVLGYAITDMQGKPLSFGYSLKRHGAKAISASIFVGFFWPLFMENKQALHDVIAKTLVVKRRSIR